MCIIVPWMDNGRIRDHMARLRDEGELVGQDFPVAVNKWVCPPSHPVILMLTLIILAAPPDSARFDVSA